MCETNGADAGGCRGGHRLALRAGGRGDDCGQARPESSSDCQERRSGCGYGDHGRPGLRPAFLSYRETIGADIFSGNGTVSVSAFDFPSVSAGTSLQRDYDSALGLGLVELALSALAIARRHA